MYLRDEKLDFIRGWAMITIAINHFTVMIEEMGYRGFAVPTLTFFGFSSAAELFFLLSGYMVGLVYLKKDDFARRLASRALSIYQHNLFAFIAAMAVALVFGTVATTVSADYTIDHPFSGVLMFLYFGQHPDLLGVLQLYVLFMLATPAFVWLLRRNAAAAVCVSIAVYLGNQVLPWLNLPGGTPEGDWQWNFSPFSWQLLFFLGIVAGERQLHERLTSWLRSNRYQIPLVILTFVLVAIYYRLMVAGNVPWFPSQKETLAPMRVLHTLLTVMFLFAVALALGGRLRSPLARLVSNIGRSTLLCYTVSIPVTYAAAGFWENAGKTEPAFIVGLFVILAAVVAAAYWKSFRVRKPA